MMQQGLGALMPQQPAGQAPENPVRMAAAMDVVTSDAEENILDPRTLALIKYKDAVAAMQAADQLIAASQPTPTPPTVAERTKLAAQQGIMGLASRLAPGLQQQGNRMGAAQAQQAMTGGLAQLPAPNMAGMAGGGIVGYAEGGAADADIQRYTAQYRAIMAAVQNAGTPEQKAQLQQRLREIQSTFDPETVARAHMQMSGQGMADGGEVQGFQKGGLPTAGGREDDYVVTYDELGNPIYASDIARALAAGTTDTSEEGAARRAAYAALQTERPNLSEIARTPERPTASEERVPTPEMTDEETAPYDYGAFATGFVPESVRQFAKDVVTGGYSADELMNKVMPTRMAALRGGRGLAALTPYEQGAVAREGMLAIPNYFRTVLFPNPENTNLGTATLGDLGGAVKPRLEGFFGVDPSEVAAAAEDTPAATTATPTAASDAVDVLFDQPSPSETGPVRRFDQPSPGEMGPNATPAEYFRNKFRPAKAAAGAEAKTAAPQSRDSRDDRMRRIIAGLRGLGSQGVGGYAAGSAGEEQRLEQELIAEQERSSEEAFREREFGQKDREIEAMNNLRIAEATARAQDQAATLQFRYDQLNAVQKQAADEAYLADMRVQMANSKIGAAKAAIEKGPGVFGSTRAHNAEQMAIIAEANLELQAIRGEYLPQEFGPQSAPTATTIDPATQAALEQYSAQ